MGRLESGAVLRVPDVIAVTVDNARMEAVDSILLATRVVLCETPEDPIEGSKEAMTEGVIVEDTTETMIKHTWVEVKSYL